jgi:2',3'-cyclic-nucleotide 2'-phosphodiesterase (5'-nucleotidase family)
MKLIVWFRSGLASGLLVILSVFLLMVMGCSQRQKEGGRDENVKILTVVYSSDLLGKIRTCECEAADMGGIGRIATFVERMKKDNPNILVLDAGDNFSIDLSFSRKEAKLTWESFDIAGYDILTPGELEFVFGLPFMLEMFSKSKFDVVTANIVDPISGEQLFGSPYRTMTLPNGINVGITGVLDEKIEFPGYVDQSAFAVLPAQSSIRKILPEMKKHADFLILLSHMGLEKTKKLVENVREFDLVIVGHGIPVTKKIIEVGKTRIVATGSSGRYMGRINLEMTPGAKVGKCSMKLVSLESAMAIHPEVKELFRKYEVRLIEE